MAQVRKTRALQPPGDPKRRRGLGLAASVAPRYRQRMDAADERRIKHLEANVKELHKTLGDLLTYLKRKEQGSDVAGALPTLGPLK